jgi:hypothetical protein
MLTMLLIGCFTSFILAVLDSAIKVMAMFISVVAVNTVCSLLFASIATWLADVSGIKNFILTAVAGAFLGSAFLVIVERFSAYRPAVIQAARQD